MFVRPLGVEVVDDMVDDDVDERRACRYQQSSLEEKLGLFGRAFYSRRVDPGFVPIWCSTYVVRVLLWNAAGTYVSISGGVA